jgi:hypothetical protein
MSDRTWYDQYSANLEMYNTGLKVYVARGFLSYSVWPIILICQLRDFTYTVAHFSLKASYANIIHKLKNAKSRGVSGLLRILK